MRNELAIVGGPGAGKTSRLIRYFLSELTRGVAPERIGILAFTRAARDEIRTRLREATGVSADRLPWVRTIHSAARRLCSGVKLLVDTDWAEFAARHTYTFSDVRSQDDRDLVVQPTRTEHDQLRYLYDWGRNRRLDAMQAFDRCGRFGLRRDLFELYVKRYEEFRRVRGLVDFVDLLELVLARGEALPVEVGFVDEAQDLSELQADVVEVLYANCKSLYAAGDDDQAIYSFQGGRADWFMRIATSGSSEVLPVSHRLPGVVHDFASRIIARNPLRIPKEFKPTPRPGRILLASYTSAMNEVDGSRNTLVLARNRHYLRDQARALLARGVPFVIEGDGWPNPLGSARLVRAVNTAESLRVGATKRVPAKALCDLIFYIPITSELVSAELREATRAGVKRAASFPIDEAGLEDLLRLVRAEGPLACFTKLTEVNRRYLVRLVEEHGTLPTPRVVLNTVHGAKGREADLVVVVSDMTRATYEGYQSASGSEEENRVAYVAVTRARDTLVLAEPKTRRHFRFPSLTAEVHAVEGGGAR